MIYQSEIKDNNLDNQASYDLCETKDCPNIAYYDLKHLQLKVCRTCIDILTRNIKGVPFSKYHIRKRVTSQGNQSTLNKF